MSLWPVYKDGLITSRIDMQVAGGALEWLTPLDTMSLGAWAGVLCVMDAVCRGRLQLPFVRLQEPSMAAQGDLEAGPPVLISR